MKASSSPHKGQKEHRCISDRAVNETSKEALLTKLPVGLISKYMIYNHAS